MTFVVKTPPRDIDQFERKQAAQAEARDIVLQWLQAIETARGTGQALAELGYSVEGMDIALAAAKLASRPPVAYLRLLIAAGEAHN